MTIPMDVTSATSIMAAQQLVTERVGHVDVLVNNAAVLSGESDDVLAIPHDAYRSTFDTNVFGVIEVCRAFVPGMALAKLQAASSTCRRARGSSRRWPHVCAGVLDVESRVECVHAELLRIPTASEGVLVNAVDPGWVRPGPGRSIGTSIAKEGADTIVWLATLPDGGADGRILPRSSCHRVVGPSVNLAVGPYAPFLPSTAVVLLVADVFQPLDRLAIELLLNGDVRHRRRRRRAVPVLFTRWKPHDVARTDLLDRSAPALHASGAGRDDQRLPERMRVPRRAGARLERHGCARDACRSRRLKQRIDPHRAGKPIGRTFAGRLRTTRVISMASPLQIAFKVVSNWVARSAGARKRCATYALQRTSEQ